ncbi:hypothetical protein V9T40_014409 [Parthenolecanium corni]|uniref:Uncharacterized protein n=1 Tax=Parthenolecanium corni TaxID=536013 RepID=A0AAN9THN5_9HEMI
MHDLPYVKSKFLGPETVASMTRVCSAVRNIIPPSIPCGVQTLAAANEEAIAVALASGCNFIRAEGFVFGHVADEGYIDSCAGTLLRYRTKVKANKILVFTDIKKKHSSHSITADTSIEEVAKAAEFFLSDGIIITGSATGIEANVEELKRVKEAVQLPVIVGSGITAENIQKFAHADAFIVGSSLKYDGR